MVVFRRRYILIVDKIGGMDKQKVPVFELFVVRLFEASVKNNLSAVGQVYDYFSGKVFKIDNIFYRNGMDGVAFFAGKYPPPPKKKSEPRL